MIIDNFKNRYSRYFRPIKSAVRLDGRRIVGRNNDQTIGLADVCGNLPFAILAQFVPISGGVPQVLQAVGTLKLVQSSEQIFASDIAEFLSHLPQFRANFADSTVCVRYFHRSFIRGLRRNVLWPSSPALGEGLCRAAFVLGAFGTGRQQKFGVL